MQVHIDVFADGPTRVVRFSDQETAADMGAGVLETFTRVQQLQRRLDDTNRRFAALRGAAGSDALDMFGRAVPPQAHQYAGADSGRLPGAPPGWSAPIADDAASQSVATGGNGGEGDGTAAAAALARVAAGPNGGRLDGATASAVSMMLAGDVTVTVLGLRGVAHSGPKTNAIVRLRVGSQAQQSSIQWGAREPVWDEPLIFYGVRTLKQDAPGLAVLQLSAGASGRAARCALRARMRR
jgi:hypothetical protein